MDDTEKFTFKWLLDDTNPDVRILLKAVRERDERIEAQAAQLQMAAKFLMIQLNAIEAFGITGGASDEVRAFLAKSQ